MNSFVKCSPSCDSFAMKCKEQCSVKDLLPVVHCAMNEHKKLIEADSSCDCAMDVCDQYTRHCKSACDSEGGMKSVKCMAGESGIVKDKSMTDCVCHEGDKIEKMMGDQPQEVYEELENAEEERKRLSSVCKRYGQKCHKKCQDEGKEMHLTCQFKFVNDKVVLDKKGTDKHCECTA